MQYYALRAVASSSGAPISPYCVDSVTNVPHMIGAECGEAIHTVQKMIGSIVMRKKKMSRSSLTASLRAKTIFSVSEGFMAVCFGCDCIIIQRLIIEWNHQNGVCLPQKLTEPVYRDVDDTYSFAFSFDKRWKKLRSAEHWHERGTNCTLSRMHGAPCPVCQSVGQRTGYQTNNQWWW